MEYGTTDERKYRLGRALSRYKMLQQARMYMPVGGAWVPEDVKGKLTLSQIVRIKQATAEPCHTCLGIGRNECSKCKGTGEVKCTNKDCDNGMVKITDEQRLVNKQIEKKCPVCSGFGYISCLECEGKGGIICKDCNGTGMRPECSKCGGAGTVPCRRCDGTGKYKEVECPACHGAGMTECTSCNGDGRKK